MTTEAHRMLYDRTMMLLQAIRGKADDLGMEAGLHADSAALDEAYKLPGEASVAKLEQAFALLDASRVLLDLWDEEIKALWKAGKR